MKTWEGVNLDKTDQERDVKPFEPIGQCTFRGKLSVAEISRRWQIFVRLDWKLVGQMGFSDTQAPIITRDLPPFVWF